MRDKGQFINTSNWLIDCFTPFYLHRTTYSYFDYGFLFLLCRMPTIVYFYFSTKFWASFINGLFVSSWLLATLVTFLSFWFVLLFTGLFFELTFESLFAISIFLELVAVGTSGCSLSGSSSFFSRLEILMLVIISSKIPWLRLLY